MNSFFIGLGIVNFGIGIFNSLMTVQYLHLDTTNIYMPFINFGLAGLMFWLGLMETEKKVKK